MTVEEMKKLSESNSTAKFQKIKQVEVIPKENLHIMEAFPDQASVNNLLPTFPD